MKPGFAAVFTSAALILATQSPMVAGAAPGPRTLVIGVDHLDPPNQQLDKGRVFEYTDFFTRLVHVHRGDTLDFRTAPNTFHIVALASTEVGARRAYPFALADADDPAAPGSGLPKVQFGPSFGAITNGTTSGGGTIGNPLAFPPADCGIQQVGQQPCTFSGGADVESQGQVIGSNPNGTDWQITINAPAGTYDYFCYVHPGMHGRVSVISDDDHTFSVTTQAQIDAASQVQFLKDQADALLAEQAANVVHVGGPPGARTYNVQVGISAADEHVAIDEMLPQVLTLKQGDHVNYSWSDKHNIHTVGFPVADPDVLPPPFGPDIEPPESFELIGDPGNAPPGTRLRTPGTVVDSGLRVGADYRVQPSSQQWSVTTDKETSTGTYAYKCMIHDWMQGTLNIGS